MRRHFTLLLSIAAATAAYSAQYTPEQLASGIRKHGGPEVFIRGIAAEASKMAGQRLDDQTEIVGAAAIDRTLVYHVRAFNYSKAQIGDVSAFRKEIASRNAPSICTAPTASVLIFEFGAEYKYVVYSKVREHLFEYTFKRDTCAPDYRW